MNRISGVAIGAGLASALLFVVSAKGTEFSTVMAYVTALPIMIAALGYGHLSGLAGAAMGTVAVTFALGPILGGFYAIIFALPSWWLAYLVLLARPAPPMASPKAASQPTALWYPVGRVVIWAVALACAAVLVIGVALVIRFGGYAEASAALARRLSHALAVSGDGATDRDDLAHVLVRLLPLAMAASSCLMLLVNLWLAGRISQMSHRLSRPWPNVPDALRLPHAAAGLLAFCGVLCIVQGLGDTVQTIAATLASALGLVFALQGLGTAHVLTRGFAGRAAILTVIYLVTVMVPPAVAALALLGMVDCLGSLRSRRQPPSPPVNPKGVSPWK